MAAIVKEKKKSAPKSTKSKIKKAIEEKKIVIKPFNENQLQIVSYDVRLSNEFQVTDRHSIDFVDPAHKKYPKTRIISVSDGEEFILHPGENVLGKQVEYIGCDLDHLILLSVNII